VEPVPLYMRFLSFVHRVLLHLAFRIRRVLAVTLQGLQRDELTELSRETKQLGSASAESLSHLGAEVREINDRLARLEEDLARVTRLLEHQQTGSGELQKAGRTSVESLSPD
jgi:hypothetical protein